MQRVSYWEYNRDKGMDSARTVCVWGVDMKQSFFERHRDTLSFLAWIGVLLTILTLSILKICGII